MEWFKKQTKQNTGLWKGFWNDRLLVPVTQFHGSLLESDLWVAYSVRFVYPR